jgi:hypothetical protein
VSDPSADAVSEETALMGVNMIPQRAVRLGFSSAFGSLRRPSTPSSPSQGELTDPRRAQVPLGRGAHRRPQVLRHTKRHTRSLSLSRSPHIS